VALQRNHQLPAARHRFEQALTLNTNNLSATVNLQCNTNLQAAIKLDFSRLEEMVGRFHDLPHLAMVLNSCGPVDEPVLCFLLGRIYQQGGFSRQALQQIERSKTLAPDALSPALALAGLYSRHRMDDKVFELIKQLRATTFNLPTNQVAEMDLELSLLEARSYMSQTNVTKARGILQSILNQHPDDTAAAGLVFQTYIAFGDLTNALQLVTSRVAREPDNIAALNHQAGLLIQLGKATEAIPILNHALAITNAPASRLYRAIAYVQIHDLTAAAAEYHQLEREATDPFSVHYGLAVIAEQSHDTNLAIQHLTICLTNVPPGSENWEYARAHLDVLKNVVGHDAVVK
jgi:thioredoxin-like negative regulator of GroEL